MKFMNSAQSYIIAVKLPSQTGKGLSFTQKSLATTKQCHGDNPEHINGKHHSLFPENVYI